ncbi:MAG: hypothetical protein A2X93_06505 [Deltaproteobacteria bacterium GWC2_56_8]|nr:MAG: hypothetical protein A2X99_04475 [Deltaproteobacteria bacterium GWB2_55_19]OGP36224.1 MAG: hypothetical protein A2X93_06505 [Deltaproteobacteria bacterium GWC2_56_8]HAO94200.1 hypothetical protein [Deltaproteobacteria bacterium]
MKKPGSRAALLALALLLFILPGCGGILIETRHIIDEIEANPGKGSFIRDVPFYPQDEYMCGPASLASLVAYWGATGATDIDEAIIEVYQTRLKGTLPIDMLLFAKDKGMEAAYYKGGLDDLREKIAQKTPLILFLNLGFESYPVGHYIVAVGYSDISGMVIAHSGMDKERVYSYEALEKAWSKTGYSTLLIKSKGGRR